MTQLNFEQALTYLKEGGKIMRESWSNPKYIYIDDARINPIQGITHSGHKGGYMLSSEDLLSEDWVFVLEEDFNGS